MFDSSTPASFLSIQPARRGRHDAFLERSLPRWLVDTSVERKIELKNTQPHIPEWYATATDTQKKQLKTLLEIRFTSQNRLDNHLRALQAAQTMPWRGFADTLDAAWRQGGFEV